MKTPSRNQWALFIASALVVVALAAPYVLRADDGFAADGYLKEDGRCLVLTEHDGRQRVLTGAVGGLGAQDHVRLWGRSVRGSECGRGPAYEVTEVLTVWANDRHTKTFYDHEKDGSFERWARRNRN